MSSVAARVGWRAVPRLATHTTAGLKRPGKAEGGRSCATAAHVVLIPHASGIAPGRAHAYVHVNVPAVAAASLGHHHRCPLRCTALASTAPRRSACAAAAAAGEEVGDAVDDVTGCPTPTIPGHLRKQRLVFLGTPDVAAAALEALFDAAAAPDAAFEVHAVVSQPGRPRGRGRSKTGPPPPSPVAAAAAARGLPPARVLCPSKANEEDFLAELRAMAPDLMVTAAYGNYLPRAFLDIPRLGTLNIHPSLLPSFRGAAPVQRALESGTVATGVSVAYTVQAMVGARHDGRVRGCRE